MVKNNNKKEGFLLAFHKLYDRHSSGRLPPAARVKNVNKQIPFNPTGFCQRNQNTATKKTQKRRRKRKRKRHAENKQQKRTGLHYLPFLSCRRSGRLLPAARERSASAGLSGSALAACPAARSAPTPGEKIRPRPPRTTPERSRTATPASRIHEGKRKRGVMGEGGERTRRTPST